MLVFAAAIAGAVALVLYAPYLSMRESGIYSDRHQIFLFPDEFLPAGPLFPGFLSLVLAATALAWPRDGRDTRPSRSLRWSLLGSALLLAWIATGGHLFSWHPTTAADLSSVDPKRSLPWTDPTPEFAWLQNWLPGFRIGRAPRYVYGAAHVCLSLLVACGAADLVHRFQGARRRAVCAAALCAALLAAVGLGVVPAVPYKAVRQRPPEARLEFFQALAAHGNRGPLLELPLVAGVEWWSRASSSLLVSAYHRRETSECFSSFTEAHLTPELRRAAERIPSPDALEAIRAFGFTTVLVHQGSAADSGNQLADRLARAAEAPGAALRLAGSSDGIVAFELVAQPATRSAP
jgi:hypothetical protein